jgi:hypothetical protein
MQAVFNLTVFADYFQFIVQDEASVDDFSAIWTPEAFELGVAVGQSAVCPGTLRNVDVSVEIAICEGEPDIDLDSVDHAVEASIKLPTGKLVVMCCTGYFADAPRFTLPQGTYRALVLMQGIETIKTEWEPADDKYIVYLWPGETRETKLLKHWKSGAT